MTEAKGEPERIILLIQTMQRILGISNRDLERRLDLSPSYLTRLYNRTIELRFEHIVNLVPAMGLRLEEFFWLAYPRSGRPPSDAARRLRELFDLFDRTGEQPRPTSGADLERLLETAMRKVMEEARKESAG